jgi:hypothetical protein
MSHASRRYEVSNHRNHRPGIPVHGIGLAVICSDSKTCNGTIPFLLPSVVGAQILQRVRSHVLTNVSSLTSFGTMSSAPPRSECARNEDGYRMTDFWSRSCLVLRRMPHSEPQPPIKLWRLYLGAQAIERSQQKPVPPFASKQRGQHALCRASLGPSSTLL